MTQSSHMCNQCFSAQHPAWSAHCLAEDVQDAAQVLFKVFLPVESQGKRDMKIQRGRTARRERGSRGSEDSQTPGRPRTEEFFHPQPAILRTSTCTGRASLRRRASEIYICAVAAGSTRAPCRQLTLVDVSVIVTRPRSFSVGSCPASESQISRDLCRDRKVETTSR
ncbi:hypothetical protein BC628DRAFT_670869 [Trametes gibbosa]|nr:hypothetical protein BC628DRAFT_670869 [Trametes gibbosa]